MNDDQEELIVSAMLIACEEGNLAGLDQLATLHRINLNIANRLGETAMHVSAGAGHYDIVHYLHMKGAALDIGDRRGDTPLFWAARHGHVAVVSYLTNENVNVNTVNKSRETALHVATRYTQLETVLILLEHGADISLQDEHGETALHIASWHGYATLLAALCRYGPLLEIKNKASEQPHPNVPTPACHQLVVGWLVARAVNWPVILAQHYRFVGWLYCCCVVCSCAKTTQAVRPVGAGNQKPFKIYSRFLSGLKDAEELEATKAASMVSQPHITSTVGVTAQMQPHTKPGQQLLPDLLSTTSTSSRSIEHPRGCHSDRESCISSEKSSLHKDDIAGTAENVVDLSDIKAVAGSDFTSLISSLASLSSGCSSSKGFAPRTGSDHPVLTRQQSRSMSCSGDSEQSKSCTGILPCARATPATSKFVSLVTNMGHSWDDFCGCSTVAVCSSTRGGAISHRCLVAQQQFAWEQGRERAG
ncbi:unnamed protein product [Toxocara canis]|uniref:ANK_REP_REGION domain-containing protein n=1 Tax=Toxocara canis TaxID=6265 RepID=A0A183TXF0_TOXCA|nr:unnamed protein product [Toxocara canis]